MILSPSPLVIQGADEVATMSEGKLLQGTCGWASPHQALSIYGGKVRGSEERLRIYSRKAFAALEIDTTTYAIPNPERTRLWAGLTPPGFTFLVKAFGAFCGSVDVGNLPKSTRAVLGVDRADGKRVNYSDLCEAAREDLWTRFHAALEPLRDAGKLGCVVFQFHLSSFGPNRTNRTHVEHLRSRLSPRIRMAVEFRDRAWIQGDEARRTVEWCRANDFALVGADELHHETMQPDRAQTGLRPGEVKRCMPTLLAATCEWGSVVRVHRRHGTRERLLEDDEIRAWGRRIREVAPRLRGPIWCLWGTDWKDAAIENAAKLAAAVGDEIAFDWIGMQKKASMQEKGGIASLFAKAQKSELSAEDRAAVSLAKTHKRPAEVHPARTVETSAIARMFAAKKSKREDDDERPEIETRR